MLKKIVFNIGDRVKVNVDPHSYAIIVPSLPHYQGYDLYVKDMRENHDYSYGVFFQ